MHSTRRTFISIARKLIVMKLPYGYFPIYDIRSRHFRNRVVYDFPQSPLSFSLSFTIYSSFLFILSILDFRDYILNILSSYLNFYTDKYKIIIQGCSLLIS